MNVPSIMSPPIDHLVRGRDRPGGCGLTGGCGLSGRRAFLARKAWLTKWRLLREYWTRRVRSSLPVIRGLQPS